MGHTGDDYGTVSRSAWHPELEMAFSVMINRWWNDYPAVKTDMHSVYCHFWKVLLPLMAGDVVPGVATAFACPAVHPVPDETMLDTDREKNSSHT